MPPLSTRFVTEVLPNNAGIAPVESVNEATVQSSTDGITAQHVSPGQSTAVPLTSAQNRVTTVTTANDAVRLPPALVGMVVTVSNAAANNLGVYPALGDAINALGANNMFAQAQGRTTYRCYTKGTWQTA